MVLLVSAHTRPRIQHLKKAEIRNKITQELNKFENILQYKTDNEFIKLIANYIEHYVKKKYNINKLDLFFEIYRNIFHEITDEEKQSITKIIQFIFDNGHIKKIPYKKLILSFIGDWLKKKIL